MLEKLSANLAANIRELREARGLSQQVASKMAGIPRPTWANLESGSANPTLAVVVRVASALQISIEELLAPPRSTGRLYASSELPSRTRNRVVVRQLLPDPIPGIAVERMEFAPGALMVGVPHTRGTREYLTCESGEVSLTASGETWSLTPGDVVVFRGDQKHSYRNPGTARSVAYSVVLLAPVPS